MLQVEIDGRHPQHSLIIVYAISALNSWLLSYRGVCANYRTIYIHVLSGSFFTHLAFALS